MYSVPVAYLLWLLSGFGVLGFHRFYMGKIPSGILFFFTGGLFGLGSLYDLITMPEQVDRANRLRFTNEYVARERMSWEGRARRMHGSPRSTASAAPVSLETVILKTARLNRGLASPAQVALEADVELEKAKAELETLSDKGFCEMRVKKTGAVTYFFPEFADEYTEDELEQF